MSHGRQVCYQPPPGTPRHRGDGESILRWTSPEGHHFLVRYIANLEGFHVIESNAVPVNAAGARADGRQRAPLHAHAHVPGGLPDGDMGEP
ncbi:hypothetical protein O3P69_011522 [Scylla paramamosain]|uniref:Uncharacterized protein n=1 Tax=Scylla paramamosain TaxID=85552 RepID=A0AAW0T766_SCYPA